MSKDSAESIQSEEKNGGNAIEIMFFKSETCAFCPRAEEVIRDLIDDFDPGVFRLKVINVTENPEAAEEYGIFALPTIVIGGVSVTGIPEPEMLMRMILGSRVAKKRSTHS